jgi:hypothetical protein
MSTDIKERISTMGYLFVAEDIADPSITAIDSTLLKAKGHVWHKSSRIKGIVSRSGIDTDAKWWGYSHTKGWIFGYKLHLTSSTTAAATTTAGKEIIVPLTADVTAANIPDNKIYVPLTSSHSTFSVFSFPLVCYMVADPAYDAKKLYGYSKSIGSRPGLSSVERYENTPKERLEMVCFYESEIG